MQTFSYLHNMLFGNRKHEYTDRILHNVGSSSLEGGKNQQFVRNHVVTSKYTVFTFIFKNLYEQFHKYSNCYFLVISILQCMPQITTTNGVPTFAWPLLFVLTVNAAKDAYEDWRRHKSDALENNAETYILPHGWKLGGTIDQSIIEEAFTYPSALTENNDNNYNNFLIKEEEEQINIPQINENPQLDDEENDEEQALEEEFKLPLPESPLVTVGFKQTPWQNVNVGDIVICRNRDVFPADLVLLASSDNNGIAFVETSSLDGETNLKVKQGVNEIVNYLGNNCLKTFELLSNCDLQLKCNIPDKDLNSFTGKLKLSKKETNNRNSIPNNYISLSINQLLLRGCKLRNTNWIVGLVTYTGHETKIMMNSTPAPRKLSRVERLTNRLTFLIWSVQIFACMICGIISGQTQGNNYYQELSYLNLPNDIKTHWIGFLSFLTWIVLSANFVPISLIVTMGMVKAVQAYFMMIDIDMYDNKTNTYACPRTSDLNEELGQVEYIFTDKTGTLTKNIMEFRKCCINGITFGIGNTEVRRQVLHKTGKYTQKDFEGEQLLNSIQNDRRRSIPHVNFHDPKLLTIISNENDPMYDDTIEFFIHLASNHSVIPETDLPGGNSSNKATGGGGVSVRYSASSPDEGALVYAAKYFGVQFHSRDPCGLTLDVRGIKLYIEILATMEFTSTRKRSSILCRYIWKNKEKIVLYTKGADSIIYNLLKNKNNLNDNDNKTFKIIQEYAEDALRTLCIAKREITKEEFNIWYEKYKEALLLTENRENIIEKLAEELEISLILQGITGVEDTLQDDVPKTIENLRDAGLKVWMLTGDKVETAINIALATSLVGCDDYLVTVSFETVNNDLSMIGSYLKNHLNKFKKNQENNKNIQFSIVIDGSCLQYILDNIESDCYEEFLNICKVCHTAVCARVTPLQKGEIVRIVKNHLKSVTLAIGDGANDCSMIQRADVGIGLRGQEGLQAFNNSDYGLSQFKFLQCLLLVHGRWCYRRTTKLVLYMFYKNIVLVMPIFFYGIFSVFSGQKIYFEFLYQLFNVIFTAMPVVLYAVFEQDIDKASCYKYPSLYRYGHSDYYFNNKLFIGWITNAIFHGIIIFTFPTLIFALGQYTHNDGTTLDRLMIGNIVFFLVSVVVNLKILIETSYITWLPVLGVVLSILGVILFMFLFSFTPSVSSSMLGSSQYLITTPKFYMCCIATVSTALGRDHFFKMFKRTFRPELHNLIQDREILGKQVPFLDEVEAIALAQKKKLQFQVPEYGVTVVKSPSVQRAGSCAFSEADRAIIRVVSADAS